MFPETEIQDNDSRVGLRGRYAIEVYRQGARIDLDSFNKVHPWIVEDPVTSLRVNPETGKPRFLPRRFTSEDCARQSSSVSGGRVYEERSLARMNAESAWFLNPEAQRG